MRVAISIYCFANAMKRILSLLFVSLLLSVLFWKLNANYSESFTEVEERGRGKNPTSVNLVKGCDTARIASVLSVQKYLPTREDAVFAARCMSAVLEKGETLNTLYDLMTKVGVPFSFGSPTCRCLIENGDRV